MRRVYGKCNGNIPNRETESGEYPTFAKGGEWGFYKKNRRLYMKLELIP